MLNQERGRRYVLRFQNYALGRIIFVLPNTPLTTLYAIAAKLYQDVDEISGTSVRAPEGGREFIIIVLIPPVKRRPRCIVEAARKIAEALLEAGYPCYLSIDPGSTEELSVHEWARGN